MRTVASSLRIGPPAANVVLLEMGDGFDEHVAVPFAFAKPLQV
jgi:hypothetical protein